MRRKLINWEAFERIQKDSLSAAEHELLEASDLLARGLGIDQLELDCYSDSNVVYETLDGTYVRADYNLSNDHITFENIEELVVDEETASTANKRKIFDMVEAILSNENDKAKNFLGEYMSSPIVRKGLMEGRMPDFIRDKVEKRKAGKAKSLSAGTPKDKFRKEKLDAVANPNKKPRKNREEGKGPKDDPNYFKKMGKKYDREGRKRKVFTPGGIEIKKHMKECYKLSENVIEYVSLQQYGPILKESAVRRDNSGNVVAIRIPTLKVRNENQILTLNHRHMLDSEVKTVRENAHKLSHDMMFCRQVAELKRQNNLSDGEGLQESLSSLVGQWPSVLYLSQTELAAMIAEALNVVGVSNYDDATCTFMAEGILRTAHEVFGDKVEKILRLASAQIQVEGDQYAHFQDVVHQFFPTLDESYHAQLRVFQDLFRAVNEVWNFANESGDAELINQSGSILEDLHAVCRGDMTGDLELAEEVAQWLQSYAESNLDVNGDWDVSNTPYTTLNGDHPAMAEKAKKAYSPSGDFGDDAQKWQDRATEKQFQGPQWTNVGGDGVYPNLDNPYIPKPFGDYTMNGEQGVEKSWKDGEGSWQSDDTWPNLRNPYIPKPENWNTYKMKNGPETDLVQDR
jgi:hypothetical protein